MEVSILDSIPDINDYKSFTDRYFSKRYITNVNGIKNNDIMIMFHSNRIALLSLAPSHYFFKNKRDFKINFSVGKFNRLDNSVKGKSKKGGQLLAPNSVVCKIQFEDGTSVDVPCCMRGKLVEINEELIKEPKLLREMPDSCGFIAIILSTIAISEATKSEMMSHSEYLNTISCS